METKIDNSTINKSTFLSILIMKWIGNNLNYGNVVTERSHEVYEENVNRINILFLFMGYFIIVLHCEW